MVRYYLPTYVLYILGHFCLFAVKITEKSHVSRMVPGAVWLNSGVWTPNEGTRSPIELLGSDCKEDDQEVHWILGIVAADDSNFNFRFLWIQKILYTYIKDCVCTNLVKAFKENLQCYAAIKSNQTESTELDMEERSVLQSCEMSRIWRTYPCKKIGRLG